MYSGAIARGRLESGFKLEDNDIFYCEIKQSLINKLKKQCINIKPKPEPSIWFKPPSIQDKIKYATKWIPLANELTDWRQVNRHSFNTILFESLDCFYNNPYNNDAIAIKENNIIVLLSKFFIDHPWLYYSAYLDDVAMCHIITYYYRFYNLFSQDFEYKKQEQFLHRLHEKCVPILASCHMFILYEIGHHFPTDLLKIIFDYM